MNDASTYSPEEVNLEVTELRPKQAKYCIIVVCLNEGDRLRNQLGKMSERAALADIIIADGMSSDGSTEPDFLASCGVRALLQTSDRGLGTATRMGYAYAMSQEYEAAITVDGNGKDGVEALPSFIKSFEQGFDLVQGSRYTRGGKHKNTPPLRAIGIRCVMAPLLFLGCGVWYTDCTNAFRGCSMRFLKDERVSPLRKVFQRFNLHCYLNYRAARLGFRTIEIPVTRVYPDDGTVPTKITSWRLNFLVFWEMVLTVVGHYNPDSASE